MLKLLKSAVVACAVLFVAAEARAQSAPTIDDVAWLAGRWVGEGLGGEMEEVWSPPVGGQMVGHFRLVRNGAPVFYEIILLDATEAGVRMRVKHFNPDFVGWEEKDAWITFEPVSVSETEIVFSGLAIHRESEDEITMTLRMRRADGVRDETLRFRREPL